MKGLGHIKNGKLSLDNERRFLADLKALRDGVYEVSVRPKNIRSNPQNRYLWAVVYSEVRIALVNLGNDVSVDEVHEFLKQKFNPVEILGAESSDTIGGSTAGMTKDEFSNYVEKIGQWAADFLNIEIPPPNTELKLF